MPNHSWTGEIPHPEPIGPMDGAIGRPLQKSDRSARSPDRSALSATDRSARWMALWKARWMTLMDGTSAGDRTANLLPAKSYAYNDLTYQPILDPRLYSAEPRPSTKLSYFTVPHTVYSTGCNGDRTCPSTWFHHLASCATANFYK